MAGNTINLSLLSRGIGQVKKNGSEKVDIKLEPEDYFNLKSDTLYLPPLPSSRRLSLKRQSVATLPGPALTPLQHSPRRAHSASSLATDLQEVHLPKTFSTRKGALLLFSEDFLARSAREEGGPRPPPRHGLSRSTEDLSMRTIGDLARSILTYGAKAENEQVNLRFVRDRLTTTRRVRPGFSARRYLSRLTRSFDETFLDNLMNKGYVQEKTLFQSNSLLPHLRRRINDDLSSLPPPYRILKNMLMAPGFLSGYNFFREKSGGENSSELSMVLEEEEEDETQPRRPRILNRENSSIMVVDLREGAPRSVVYSELEKEQKENVLTDLLVKSAINHALEKQREKMLEEDREEGSQSAQSHRRRKPANTSSSDQADSPQYTPRLQHFDIAEAVRSYLETAEDSPAVVDRDRVQSGRSTLKGSKLSSHSGKSFEVHTRPLPDYMSEREYVGDIPVVTFKEAAGSAASSRRSSLTDIKGVLQPNQNLPTIADVDDSLSRDPSQIMNKHTVLPPIQGPANQDLAPGGGSPSGSVASEYTMMLVEHAEVEVKPSIPQTTIHVTLPSPAPHTDDQQHQQEDVSSPSWGLAPQSSSRLGEEVPEDENSEEVNQGRKSKHKRQGSQQSVVSTISLKSGGLSLGAGSTENLDTGGTPRSARSPAVNGGAKKAKKARKKSHASPDKGESGSTVLAPDGVVIPVGGSIVSGQEASTPDDTRQPSGVDSAKEDNDPRPRERKPRECSQDLQACPTADCLPIEGEIASTVLRRTKSDLTFDNTENILNMVDYSSPPSPQLADWSGVEGHVSRLHTGPDKAWDQAEVSQPPTTDDDTAQTMVPRASTNEDTTNSPPPPETELVQALTEHAHKIAQSVLAGSDAGTNLLEDAQAAADLWKDDGQTLTRSQSVQDTVHPRPKAGADFQKRPRSASPEIAHCRDLLRSTLVSVMSQRSPTTEAVPSDVEVSPDLINALVQQQLAADDIEITKDEDGKSVIRVKSPDSNMKSSRVSRRGSALSQTMGGVKQGHIYQEPVKRGADDSSPGQQGPPRSIPAERAAETGDLGMEIIYYGEAEKAEPQPVEKAETQPEEDKREEEVKSVEKEEEQDSGTDIPAAIDLEQRVPSAQPEEDVSMPIVDDVRPETTKSSKSAKSGKRSKTSLEDREEFVVGKVDDTVELQKLYAPVDPPSPVKDPPKKPRVPPAPKVKSPVKKAEAKKAEPPKKGAKGKKGKKGKKKEPAGKEVVPVTNDEEVKVEAPVKTPPPQIEEPKPVSPVPSEPAPVTPSPEPPQEEEEMEFVFVKDVSSESEPEPEPEVEPEPEPEPEPARPETDPGDSKPPSEVGSEIDSEEEDEDEKERLRQITARDARAAKRAAQATRRKEEVERKRKEKEDLLKKEKEEQERKEKIQLEIEEERKKREESKRLERLRREEEARRTAQEEKETERRQKQEAERERRMKEEYQKRMEEMKKRALEEERRRKELESIRRQEEEERRREEEEKMAQMEEQERLEYEQRKREEEEAKQRMEEEARVRREEELRKQMEEAKRLAEEMARQQAELEKRLQFNRSLQLEAHGLGHTQDITRAFVYSYFELLQWLGLEVPDFMKLKENMPY